MRKFLLQFVLSLVFAIVCGFSMWLIREFLAVIEVTKMSPFIFGYTHFMLVIIHLGLPLGGVLGVWIANKCLSRASMFSFRGAALGFALSLLGMLLLIILRLVAEGPAGEDNAFLHLLRSDLILVLVLVSAGLLATIGYNLGGRWK